MSGIGAKLNLIHLFGLKGDTRNNVHYVNETEVVYPVGHNVVLYDTEKRDQRFIQGSDSSLAIDAIAITAINKNASNRMIAVAEHKREADGTIKPFISLYDSVTLRKRRQMSCPEVNSDRYIHVAFSYDSKYLLGLSGPENQKLVCWTVDKTKIVAILDVTATHSAEVYQADFQPREDNMILMTGDGILKFFKISENMFKAIQFTQKYESKRFVCHSWLPSEGSDSSRLIVATETGELLYFENYEYRSILNSSMKEGTMIESIVPWSKGFICGCEGGTLHIYERGSDDTRGESYKSTKVFEIDEQKVAIRSLAVSPNDENLICALENHQLFVLNLSNTEIMKENEMTFEQLTTEFHGPGIDGRPYITGLDVCIRKPLVVTCGLDKYIRVWNYMEKSTDIQKLFEEEAHSVSFHPSGLIILVGFTDKLRLMNLLMDDIRTIKEFPIKSCSECQFSNGGQKFAAASGNTVQVYHAYTGDQITTLRMHKSQVNTVFWYPDDRYLLTAGADGCVCQWDMKDMSRKAQFEQGDSMQTAFRCVVASNDGSQVIVAGRSDTGDSVGNVLKVLDLSAKETQIARQEIRPNVFVGQIALSRSNNYLFAALAQSGCPGSIRMYKFPFQGDFIEMQCHAAPVTRIRVSHDGSRIFTVAQDGSLAIFEMKEDASSQKRGMKATGQKDQILTWAEEILVTKSDLEEKRQHMEALKNKVAEMTLHNEYQLRLKDMTFNQQIKELTENFTRDLEEDRKRYVSLMDAKEEMRLQYEQKMQKQDGKYKQELENLEKNYKQKIQAEIDRYVGLSEERDRKNETMDNELKVLVKAQEESVENLKNDYTNKIQLEFEQRKVISEQKEGYEEDFEFVKQQVEEDADREIEELKEKYGKKLKEEKEWTLRLKGENGIMKNKFRSLNEDINDQRNQIMKKHNEEQKLHERIRSLNKDIAGHQKEILEREETIEDKHKRIYDLKKKNQELEKFKFVLDYKIKELKRQIAPRESEIADMKQQIKEMDHELEQYHKSNDQLDLMIGELRLKQEGMTKEINEQRKTLGDGNKMFKRYRKDLHDVVQNILYHKKLKASIVKLFKKYIQDRNLPNTDTDMQREFNREREYLERSVEGLKRQLAKDREPHRSDNTRFQRENVALTREINELRREIVLHKRQHRNRMMFKAPVPPQSSNENTIELQRILDDQERQKSILLERLEQYLETKS